MPLYFAPLMIGWMTGVATLAVYLKIIGAVCP